MSIIWGSLAGMLLYLEVIYHFSGYGWSRWNPIYTIALIIAWSAVQTMLVGVTKGKLKKIFYYGFIWIAVIWTCVQLVYLRIFKQALQWEAVFKGGGDALTNYWREALAGVLGAVPFLLLLILPAVVLGIILHKKEWKFPGFSGIHILRTLVLLVTGIAAGVVALEVGEAVEADFYEDYTEFYDPLSVAQTMGVLPTFQRDTVMEISKLVENVFGISNEHVEPLQKQPESDSLTQKPAAVGNAVGNGDGLGNVQGDAPGSDSASESATSENTANESTANESTANESTEASGTDTGKEQSDAQVNISADENAGNVVCPQQFTLDYEALHTLADNKKQTWLADYIQTTAPTTTNEYTGMFEGYNLICLTAEGFSAYAIREDLTPTLYRLVNSGFVFDNYYVPLWQTSTSDGEYINCTGLIPDGQFSMRKSAENNMTYTLPRFFAEEGVYSYAYHNNSLSYYDRYLTHPNLGYDFKGCKLGELSQEEWGGQIFPMEHPGQWPASDLEMMQGTIPEYIHNERFHVYYLTVSGHMNYNFKGNAMSAKNREAVAHLELSENARAYIACNIELDKALEYLLAQLEAAGQLEKTVICLSADHYPYAMSEEQYEELAGKSLSSGMDRYRNSMILWNAAMEEPVHISKACGSMDILPTLLNLFGFEYDSRMYAGRDVFSGEEGLVIFNDRSFVTDSVIYNRKAKETIWLQDSTGNDLVPDEQKEAYFSEKKQEVKKRYTFSAYILQENYYTDVEQAVIQPVADN